MANQSAGQAIISAQTLTTNSTTQLHPLGTKVSDRAGNEYVYLKGVASTAANDFVVYNPSDYTTTRLVVTSIGPVAVAMSACVASQFGWYQIYGLGTGANGNAVLGATGPAAIYAHSVTGAVDDAMVSGDLIHGAYSVSSQSVTGAGFSVALNYPFIDQASGSY
jgi:hypothetical protein